jgi:hypothetical protein
MAGIWFTPESPRWLMKNAKYEKAFRSFVKIRAHPIIAARDYYYSYVMFKEEEAIIGKNNYFSRMKDCFTIPRLRRANYGASTVMLAQQMCGINSKSSTRCLKYLDSLFQSSPSTVPPSSPMSDIQTSRPCMRRWDTVRFKLSSLSPLCSLSIESEGEDCV